MSKDKERPKRPPKSKKRPAIKTPTIGDKSRAGRILSQYLRKIAQEETEMIKGPDSDKMGTKAEAMARLMFKIALGYEEYDIKTEKTTIHKPSAGMIALIWDRIEGRAAAANENLDKRRTLPKKVSDENKRRMNKLATGNSSGDIN